MKYLLIMQVNPAVLEALTDEERSAIGDGHGEFMKTVQESGEFILTQALADPANTKVVRGGDVPAVTDGPFLEAKEFMGGFYLIDCESEERAVELAKLIPDTRHKGLAIEIRPVMFSSGADL
ncbi:YciI family protein [Actinophytocola glycyrrhizae]|uniref:YciI family protein n=1 Tax=Actinophytocola glycyrrhizae TaxID=2044873 RepID=A0ABV9S0A6_9PSEU